MARADYDLSDTRPKGFGKRHTLAILGFFGFALSYSMRFNLSIAIVAMVSSNVNPPKPSQEVHDIMFRKDVCTRNVILHNHPSLFNDTKELDDMYIFIPIDPTNRNNTNYSFRNGTNYRTLEFNETFNETLNKSNDISKNETEAKDADGEFDWSPAEQGFILGSFFWGYLLTQIPGGWIGHRFGGKWPFGVGLLITAVLSVATPFAARWGGFQAIAAVRAIQGFAGGVTVPCMHTLLARWIPPEERGQLTAVVYAGMPFGAAISLATSGVIIESYGWSAVFYSSGGLTIIWFIFWSLLVHNSPEDHPSINPAELKFVQHAIQGDSDPQASRSKRPPWKKIIRSGPFWAILFCQMTETWGLYTIMTELPTYMKKVLHYDIKENAMLSALPHFLTWMFGLFITRLGDFFIKRHYFSIGAVRKSCNTIGMWGSAAALLGVAYSGCDRTTTVTLLCVGIALTGGILGGVLVNLMDIASNYAGFLMGFTNTASSLSGVLAPWVAGVIVDNDSSLARWRLVFMITAGISFTGNLVFLLFSSGEEQCWNNEVEDEGDDYPPRGPHEAQRVPTNVQVIPIGMDIMDLTIFYQSPIPDSQLHHSDTEQCGSDQ